ncbi:MAG: M28 family metallopeptidase [Eubacteriales bacterium]
MTEASKYIFDNLQVRKKKEQKTAFIKYIEELAHKEGYPFRVETSGKSIRNIVVGSPESAKAVYTAHYDTCGRLPFPNFITPKNFLIYFLVQMVFVIPAIAVILAVSMGIGFSVGVLAQLANMNETATLVLTEIAFLVVYFALFFLFINGKPNETTANDNTSGVITLVEIMQALPRNKRSDVAFVFFDLEELGLRGSSAFAKAHKSIMKDKLILNFDCVSDGNTILFAVKNAAKRYVPALKASFVPGNGYTVDIAQKGVFYPSDQANFKAGVGVAALKYSKRFKLLYMDKIHTKHDTVFVEENIDFLTKGALELVVQL